MLRFFITLLIIYLIGLVFFRYLLPFFIRRQFRKYSQEPKQKKKKGVNIDYVPEGYNDSESTSDGVGEYVDFEDLTEEGKKK